MTMHRIDPRRKGRSTLRAAIACLVALIAVPGWSAPVEAPSSEETPPPQPVVLDWSGSFRLSDPPRNLPAGAKVAPLRDPSAVARAESEAKRAARALAVEDRSTTRTGYRRMASEGQSITVEPPEPEGPINVGARIGNYRAVPDTGQISARDVRLSVGVDF